MIKNVILWKPVKMRLPQKNVNLMNICIKTLHKSFGIVPFTKRVKTVGFQARSVTEHWLVQGLNESMETLHPTERIRIELA